MQQTISACKPLVAPGEPREIRLGQRDLSRMLVVNREQRSQTHSFVKRLPEYFDPGDVFVINNSRRSNGVLNVRTADEEAAVEIRFTDLTNDLEGICRIYPRHFIRPRTKLVVSEDDILEVLEVNIPPHDLCRVRAIGTPLRTLLKRSGLPITSLFYRGYWDLDHYNPYYAQVDGSVESPLAGLHLTPELVQAIENRGVFVVAVTLHVVGSWLAPVAPNLPMFPEKYEISDSTATAINRARRDRNRIIACGSTVVRALETASNCDGTVRSGHGISDLHIVPGYKFQIVNAYFTNFHPSASSLMVLDAAFCEEELLIQSYELARETEYLFFEFGDAILFI